MWTARLTEQGDVEPMRIKYQNRPEDVEQALFWLGRASEYESGNFASGGRRAQSIYAQQCAGIVSHEVSVMIAKHQQDMKRDRDKGRQR